MHVLDQGRAGTMLDEHVKRCVKQSAPVVAGVGTQRPRLRGIPVSLYQMRPSPSVPAAPDALCWSPSRRIFLRIRL
jgi:hypothetical protein